MQSEPIAVVACRSTGTQSVEQTRPSSVLSREVRGQSAVYIKRYLEDVNGRTNKIIQARTDREATLLATLKSNPSFGRRLGVLNILEAMPEAATLVMEEIQGTPLSDQLENAGRLKSRCSLVRGIYLAGKWLRAFQETPVSTDDAAISNHDTANIVDYCDYRLNRLRACGSPWPSAKEHEQVVCGLSRLVEASDNADLRLVWSHGDYSAGNVIWDGYTLTPLDFGMAHADLPLVDLTYFIHRIEMLQIYRPWKRLSVDALRQAFLRGYGRSGASTSPMYRACMIRHLLCRLLKHYADTSTRFLSRRHDNWVRFMVRRRLAALLASNEFVG